MKISQKFNFKKIFSRNLHIEWKFQISNKVRRLLNYTVIKRNYTILDNIIIY